MLPRSLSRFVGFVLLLAAFLPALASAQSAWLGQRSSGGLRYFFFPSRIERFDDSTRIWQSPITLPPARGAATAAWVDAEGLYVAYGNAVYRYALDGTGETALLNTSTPVSSRGLLSTPDYLYVVHGGVNIVSVRKQNNTIIEERTGYFYSLIGLSMAPTAGKIFGRSQSVSPSDIFQVVLNGNGTLGAQTDSPYHGAYPSATQTWVFPGDARVVDSSGTIYSTGNLNYLGSFGATLTDLAFSGPDIPIVLTGSTVSAYSNTLLPTGSASLGAGVVHIAVLGTDIVGFAPDAAPASGIRLVTLPLSALNAPTPGQPVDPRGAPFTPDAVWVGNDGFAYLFSKSLQSIFRWNPTTQDYGATIPLVGVPSFAAYSSDLNRIYVAYPSGLIRRIELTGSDQGEKAFATLAFPPLGLSTAGSYCFAVDETGAWVSHHTFDVLGNRVASKEWNYYSTEYIWNAVIQKMYFFRDDTSPNDLLAEEINADGTRYPSLPAGGLGNVIDSPLHESNGWTHPIRVAPDASYVVLGSGNVHHGTTLARLPTALANTIQDAAWAGTELRTTRTTVGVTQFQAWAAGNFAQGVTKQVPGTARHLLGLNGTQLLGITLGSDGVPSFYLMDAGFNVLTPSELAAPIGLSASIISATRIDLSWRDVTGESSYLVERKTGTGGTWADVGTTGTSLTSISDTVTAGTTYFYRVTAKNGTLASPASAELIVQVVIPVAPANVMASAVSTSEIVVSWADVNLETGYVLESRSSTGSWSQRATLSANVTSYRDQSLSPNQLVYYRVRAVNGVGASPNSAEVSARTLTPPPSQPYAYVSSNTATGVTLYFSVSYADSVVVERRGGGDPAWRVVGTPSIPSGYSYVYFTDSTVEPLTSYEYRGKAVNSVGESTYSATVSATTPALPPPPVPAGLAARVLTGSSVRLTWLDTVTETSYIIQRRTDGPGGWVEAGTADANVVTFRDTGLTAGVQYSYRIAARNAVGTSAFSDPVAVTPITLVTLLADNFDPGVHPGVWESIQGGIAFNGGQGFGSSNVLWFGSAGARSATTLPINVAQGGYLNFKVRAGNSAVDGATYWDDSEVGEDVVLEYSNDGGWTAFVTLSSVYNPATNWTTYALAIPAEARGPETRFRWRQASNSGVSYDTWAIEDVSIEGAIPPVPAAPGYVFAGATSDSSIAISWQAVAGAASYRVERAQSPTGPWAQIGQAFGAPGYLLDPQCVAASWYAYRVVAVNAGGDSNPSAVAWAQTYSQMAAWQLRNFGTTDPTAGAGTHATDRDGISNLVKFAFNLPVGASAFYQTAGSGTAGLPLGWRDAVTGQWTFEFVRRRADSNPGITYTVEFSSGLQTWETASDLLEAAPLDATWERVRIRDAAVGPSPTRAGRVRVSEAP